MAKIYKDRTAPERVVVVIMRSDLCSTRSIAKRLSRSASTIGGERQRTSGTGVCDANLAHTQCQARLLIPRCLPKLHTDEALFRWFGIG